MADMGRYTAVATLAYGEESRKFASADTAFWVIPWKVLSVILLVLIGFIALVTWAIKLYVRKMLTIAGVSPELHAIQHHPISVTTKQVSVVAPIEEGILDLRNRFRTSTSIANKISSLAQFINNYKLFFMMVIAIMIFVASVIWYVQSASVSERGFEVTIEGAGNDVTISSEQMEYDQLLKDVPGVNQNSDVKEFPFIKIVNQSSINGLAAQLRIDLENKGYTVSDLTNEFGITELNTVIVYAPEFSEQALELSRDIKGSLLSAFSDASGTDTPITVYVGQDLENEVQ